MNTLFPYTVLFRAVERAGAQFAAQTQQRRRRLEQIGRRTNHLGYARAAVENAGETSLRQPADPGRSEEHTSELQSLMRIAYAVFCLQNRIHVAKQVLRRRNNT